MNKTFYGVDLGWGENGVPQAADGKTAMVDCLGMAIVQVSISPTSGTWGAASARLVRANNLDGNWFDIDPLNVITFNSTTSTHATIAVDADFRYVAIFVDTKNASALPCTVEYYMREDVP